MNGCEEVRTDLGAYALGALEPDETQRVEEHLAECASCRRELEQLSFASELLRTPLARALATESDDELVADRGLAGIAAARARERRRLRRVAVTVGGGGAALLAALGIAVSLATRPVDSFAPAGTAAALRPATGVAAAASVRLSARPWGTQVDLVTTRMPALPHRRPLRALARPRRRKQDRRRIVQTDDGRRARPRPARRRDSPYGCSAPRDQPRGTKRQRADPLGTPGLNESGRPSVFPCDTNQGRIP